MGGNRTSVQIDPSLSRVSGFVLKKLYGTRLSLCQMLLLIAYVSLVIWFSVQANLIQRWMTVEPMVNVTMRLVGMCFMIFTLSTLPLVMTGQWLNRKAKRWAVMPLLVVVSVGYGQLVLGTH